MGWMITNRVEMMGILALLGILSFLAMTLSIAQEPTQDLQTGRALSEARQVVDGWTFRPASWGTLAVPWYLEVDVPGGDSFLSSTGTEVGSR